VIGFNRSDGEPGHHAQRRIPVYQRNLGKTGPHAFPDLWRTRGAPGQEDAGRQLGKVATHCRQGAFHLIEKAVDGDIEIIAAQFHGEAGFDEIQFGAKVR